jgi:hypothetical protein
MTESTDLEVHGVEPDLPMRQPPRPLPVMSDEEIRKTFRTADALAKSGFFKDATKATQAYAKILAGRDLGLAPFEAMSALHVIEGKIEASADLHASRVKAHPEYDYRVRELTNERCVIDFYDGPVTGENDNNWKLGTSEFTMEDAERAGLVRKGSPWEKFPRNMLFARAMSNGVAWYCPDVMGGLRVYTAGELPTAQDVTAGEGDYVEPESVEAAVDEMLDFEKVPGSHAQEVVDTIKRARDLGHAGYSDLGTARTALKGQDLDAVVVWLMRAKRDLDAMETEQIPDAEVVEGESALELDAKADDLFRQAAEADAAGEADRAAELQTEAEQLRERAREMVDPGQMELED